VPKIQGGQTTHRFTWKAGSILFESCEGHVENGVGQFADWLFQPAAAETFIRQKPMPVHINLWCAGGKPPTDGREVEVIIRKFTFD
jgi:hypothetical protein